MDHGIWVTWYDLPEHGREEHLAWVHETYIPNILKREGYQWAAHYRSIEKDDVRVHTDDPSVQTGTQFLLIFGGEYADVFGRPVPLRTAVQKSATVAAG